MRRQTIINNWLENGRLIPPPPDFKQFLVKRYAKIYKTRILVETGTFLGEMVFACKNNFNRIYSIELDNKLAARAKFNFKSFSNITIIEGDSSVELPAILEKVMEPALFWLDGHYSGGFTAKGKFNTPVLQELTHIIRHHIKQHVILIDDARCFDGTDDYPCLEEMKDLISNRLPQSDFEVKNDIIRITPDSKEYNLNDFVLPDF
jgi:hypothetical protein